MSHRAVPHLAVTRRDPTALIDNLALDEGSAEPLMRQLYRALRDLILSGSLKSGAKLPSTRTLARHLKVARTTIISAFELLAAEGFIDGAAGSGTYVAETLVPEAQAMQRGKAVVKPGAPPRLSARGRALGTFERESALSEANIFAPTLPALDAFPFDEWRRLLARACRREGRNLLDAGDPRGWPQLRQAIAGYLGPARGVVCDPAQIIVLSSARQAGQLAARLLADDGDFAWVEEPGYPEVDAALLSAGLRLALIPVDGEGIDTRAGQSIAPHARLASVTPSHHYPLGATMTLARRLELLEWASHAGAVIIEDDYDGEFRYGGKPLTALYGLDGGERVIYVGTFSKVMFRSLRLAYMVCPAHLVDVFAAARRQIDGHAVAITQAALAEFMESGGFAAHIRRMRALYKDRQDTLVALAQRHLEGALVLRPSNAGLHLVGHLQHGVSDESVAAALPHDRVSPGVLSRYYRTKPAPSGLILGYAAWDEPALREGVIALARAIEITRRRVDRRR
ncbi:MAG TPA: PLP-dependent aminotransferase family protein [Alphaproteobacteria bacterium]|nr:PLP-dependent aminotransferase family protein [Alphaproteobacteria bacterium]